MRLNLLLLSILFSLSAIGQSFYMFVGTYTDNGSKGIYVYRFNSNTGRAEWVSNTDSLVNPSYLTIAPDKKHIYAVTETATNNTGSVSAFSFDRTTGKLTFINKQSSGGANPCYITVHNSNKWVVVGNYTGGNLSVLPIKADGSLAPLVQTIQDTGKGINKERQEKAHLHSTVFSPDYKYLFTPDLGIDKIMIYNFNAGEAKPLSPANPSYTSITAGSGPRHFTFHPNNKFAYIIEELSGTIDAFKYSNGKPTFIQRIATHPADYQGAPGSADIHISPDGKFLYASNRGEENNIAIFSINSSTGFLTAKGYQSTEGKTPRNFIIDPSGKYLIAANQSTNNIVVFKRDAQTGLLQQTGPEIKVPRPVCIQMMAE